MPENSPDTSSAVFHALTDNIDDTTHNVYINENIKRTTFPCLEKCEHGVVKKYCFNCKFTTKYGMKIEMFEGHHYVRLHEVDKFLKAMKRGEREL